MNTYEITAGAKTHKIEVVSATASSSSGDVAYRVRLDGHEIAVSCISVGQSSLSLIVNGSSFDVACERTGELVQVSVHGTIFECIVSDPRSLRARKKAGLADSGEQKMTAAMPGKVVRITASVGDQIKAGQGILVIEAMKMQNEVRSPKDGHLRKILARQGANVVAGEVLAIIE